MAKKEITKVKEHERSKPQKRNESNDDIRKALEEMRKKAEKNRERTD